MEAMWHAGLGRSVNYEVQAVSEDPDLQVGQVIAIMNGYVVEDSRTPEVMEQAQQAVATNPGDPLKAVRHWKAYLKLDRTSSWAEIARKQLERLRESAIVRK